jgi:hypothetical protein
MDLSMIPQHDQAIATPLVRQSGTVTIDHVITQLRSVLAEFRASPDRNDWPTVGVFGRALVEESRLAEVLARLVILEDDIHRGQWTR